MANLPARNGGSVRSRVTEGSGGQSSGRDSGGEDGENSDPFSGGRTGTDVLRDAGEDKTADKTGSSSPTKNESSDSKDTESDPFSGGRTGTDVLRDAGENKTADKTGSSQSDGHGVPNSFADKGGVAADNPAFKSEIERRQRAIRDEYPDLDRGDYRFVVDGDKVRTELTPSGQEAFQTSAELDAVASRIDEQYPNATGFDVERVFDDGYRAEIETEDGTVVRQFAFDNEAAEAFGKQTKKRPRRGFSGVNPQTAEAISRDIASQSRGTSGSFINTNSEGKGYVRTNFSTDEPRFESDGTLAGDIDAFVKNTQSRGTSRDPYATSVETEVRNRLGDPGAGLREFGSGAQQRLDEGMDNLVESGKKAAATPLALPLAANQLLTNEDARERTVSSLLDSDSAKGGVAGAAAAGVVAPEPVSTGTGLLILGGLAAGAAIGSQTSEITVPEDGGNIGQSEIDVQESNPQRVELPVQDTDATGSEISVPSDGQFSDTEVQVPSDGGGFGSSEIGIHASSVATVGAGAIGESPASPTQSPFRDFQSMIDEAEESSVGGVETIERPDVQRDYLAEIDGLAGTVTAGELGNPTDNALSEAAEEPTVDVDFGPDVETEAGVRSGLEDVPATVSDSQYGSPSIVDSPLDTLTDLGAGVGTTPGVLNATAPGFGPESVPSTAPVNANPDVYEYPNEVVEENVQPNAYPNEFGFGFGNETPRPRADDSRMFDFGGGFDTTTESGSNDDYLAPGWGRETVSTIATLGLGAGQSPSQEQLSAVEDDYQFGELPTGADLFGGSETQQNIDDVEDLLGGFGGFRI